MKRAGLAEPQAKIVFAFWAVCVHSQGRRTSTAESIEWIIEDQAFSPSYDLAPPQPPSTLAVFLPVDGQIIRRRKRLVLYKSFNTLWSKGKGGSERIQPFGHNYKITTCLWSSFYAETHSGGVVSEGQISHSTSIWTGAEAPCPTVLARVQAYSPAPSLVASTVSVRSWLLSSSSPSWYLHRKVGPEVGVLVRKLSQLSPLRSAKRVNPRYFIMLCGIRCELTGWGQTKP